MARRAADGSVGGRRRGLCPLLALLAALLGAGALVPVVPPAQAAVVCEGDECQSPPPAPEDPLPGSAAVEAPGNPPPHWPEDGRPAKPKRPHHHHHHHHHHGAGRR